jgi:plasmid maintenance system antidote protein VapI
MKKTCTAEEILEMVRRDVEASSQVALAKVIGVSSVYISDILGGRRPVSDRIANHYGFHKETVYNKAS